MVYIPHRTTFNAILPSNVLNSSLPSSVQSQSVAWRSIRDEAPVTLVDVRDASPGSAVGNNSPVNVNVNQVNLGYKRYYPVGRRLTLMGGVAVGFGHGEEQREYYRGTTVSSDALLPGTIRISPSWYIADYQEAKHPRLLSDSTPVELTNHTGTIDFSTNQGHLRLEAGGEINLPIIKIQLSGGIGASVQANTVNISEPSITEGVVVDSPNFSHRDNFYNHLQVSNQSELRLNPSGTNSSSDLNHTEFLGRGELFLSTSLAVNINQLVQGLGSINRRCGEHGSIETHRRTEFYVTGGATFCRAFVDGQLPIGTTSMPLTIEPSQCVHGFIGGEIRF